MNSINNCDKINASCIISQVKYLIWQHLSTNLHKTFSSLTKKQQVRAKGYTLIKIHNAFQVGTDREIVGNFVIGNDKTSSGRSVSH